MSARHSLAEAWAAAASLNSAHVSLARLGMSLTAARFHPPATPLGARERRLDGVNIPTLMTNIGLLDQ
jgi:hypothetical protein